MATNSKLGRDIFLALAAVGWADGQLTPEAADALVRAALEEGMDLEEIQAIEEATKTACDIGVVDRMGMSKADRLYVYAVASWIAHLDGKVSEKEREALATLGTALGVPEAPRRHADEIMQQIALEGDRPLRFDLVRLRSTLAERLEDAQAARQAQKIAEKGAEQSTGTSAEKGAEKSSES